jgi:hypothetical protein
VKITKKRLKEIIKEEYEALNLQEVGPRSDVALGRREAEIDYGAGRPEFERPGWKEMDWRTSETARWQREREGEEEDPRGDEAYHSRRVELEQGQEASPYHDLVARALDGDEKAYLELNMAAKTDPNAQAILDAYWDEQFAIGDDETMGWNESRRRKGSPKNFKLTKNTLKHLVKKEFKTLK